MKANTFKKLNGNNLKIAIVQARFNRKITDKLTVGALKALKQAGVPENRVIIFETPGVFEIPLACQKLARSGRYHGIITIGAVIKGQTAHFEYISQAAISGVMQVMLKTDLPVALGIITAYSEAQAQARAKNDQANKGFEAALALVETILSHKR